jgi:hypothetical protein
MSTYSTVIGEGDAPVDCEYHVNNDGEVEELEVMLYETNITKALSAAQIEHLEGVCLKAYEEEARESQWDAAIENYISNQEFA